MGYGTRGKPLIKALKNPLVIKELLKWGVNVTGANAISEARSRVGTDYNRIPSESLRLLARSVGKPSPSSPELFQVISEGSVEELRILCADYPIDIRRLRGPGYPRSRVVESSENPEEVVGVKCIYEKSSRFDSLSWTFVTKPADWMEKVAYLVSEGIDKSLFGTGPRNDDEVLQYAANFLTPSEFHIVLRHFVENEETAFLAQSKHVLQKVLTNFDPLNDTLALLASQGVEFNVGERGGTLNTPMYYAIKHNRSYDCLENLVHFGAKLNETRNLTRGH